jgi:hypothetical protein
MTPKNNSILPMSTASSQSILQSMNTEQITIRPAYADDQSALLRLAALDSSDAPPQQPLLLAEVDGELRAALSLADGSAIADPFYPTASIVGLLRNHARHAQRSSRIGRARRRVPRLALSLR